MDIRMPEMDGLAATAEILATPELEATRVVILTTFDLDEYVFDAIRIGASGFLVKDTPPHPTCWSGSRPWPRVRALLSPGVTRRLIEEFATKSKAPAPTATLDLLTERERQVVALVAAGLNNDEIAARLVMSPATADALPRGR